MKILRALSCPKNGWGHCSCFGRSLGRSVCLKEHPKSRTVGECRTLCIFTNTARNTSPGYSVSKNVLSTLSDLTNIPNTVKYIHIIWIPSVSFCSGRLLTVPVLHVESWSTKTVGTKWASRDEARAETALPEGQQLSVITCTASQSAVLRCYRWRAWFVTRLGHCY